MSALFVETQYEFTSCPAVLPPFIGWCTFLPSRQNRLLGELDGKNRPNFTELWRKHMVEGIMRAREVITALKSLARIPTHQQQLVLSSSAGSRTPSYTVTCTNQYPPPVPVSRRGNIVTSQARVCSSLRSSSPFSVFSLFFCASPAHTSYDIEVRSFLALSLFSHSLRLPYFSFLGAPPPSNRGAASNVHMQVSIGFLMSARCMDLGTLLKLVPAIHDVVSVM